MSRNYQLLFFILNEIHHKRISSSQVIYFIVKHQKRIGYANCRKNLTLENKKVFPFSATFIYVTFKRKL